MQRRGGLIQVKVNGEIQEAKGEWTYGLGVPNRKAVLQPGRQGSRVVGYIEEPQAGFIEGEITDRRDLDLEKLGSLTDCSVYLELACGKSVTIAHAFLAGGVEGHTSEGNIGIRFEGDAHEVR